MSNLFLLKKVNTKLFFVIFSMSFFVGCSDLDYVNVVNDDVVVSINLNVDSIIENSVDIHDDIQEEYSWDISTENIRSASPIRVRFPYNESTRDMLKFNEGLELFDLDKLIYYNEFVFNIGINSRPPITLVFTTDKLVHDFRILQIEWNENQLDNNGNIVENERRYNIVEVLYQLDELTPDMPLVVTGVTMGGSALAVEGFSYVDENGIVRYFEFHTSGYEGDDIPNVGEF